MFKPDADCRMISLRRIVFIVVVVIWGTSVGTRVAKGQAVGQRPFIAPEPVELGFVETATGDVHLEIPMGSFPQRASGQPTTYRLVYDSNIWSISSSNVWDASGVQPPFYAGWRLVADDAYYGGNTIVSISCGQKYVNFIWVDASGVEHFFPITTQYCPNGTSILTGDAYAQDSSGYHMYVTNYNNSVVYGPDGTLVTSLAATDQNGHYILREDSNGNYSALTGPSQSPSGYFDNVGRQAIQMPCGGAAECVLTSTGGYSPWNITYATIPVKTHFGQSGVTECSNNCTISVIQSMVLPDGTTYNFKYDCDSGTGNGACSSASGQSGYYGTLTGLTLPTGGQITYAYSTFVDSYRFANRFVSSRTAAGGTWTYTPQVISNCSSTQVGCQEKMTVTKPSGASTVYTFTLNNGAWPVQIQQYDSGGALLATVTDTWDFSNSCPLYQCIGAGYIRRTAETLSVSAPSGTITKQTQYTYDSPQTGNITAIKEWNFYPGSSPTFPYLPDRATYTTYQPSFGKNIINRPTSTTVCTNTGSDPSCIGGGGKVSQTLIAYDTLALASVSGIANHDDTNFGSAYTARGNPTQIQQWVSGSTYLTEYLFYDTTGQVVKVLDPLNTPTIYSYTDNFYSDTSSSGAPQTYTAFPPTNAYMTSVTIGSLTNSYGYYYGSGKNAVFTDTNGLSTYSHFFDPLDRATGTSYPIGWNLTTYPTATESDSYSSVGDLSPSTACSSCLHSQLFLDSWGRESSRVLANNPIGSTIVASSYDGSGRVATQTHPYVGTSGVAESFSYDGLDRILQTGHPDGQSTQIWFGSAVTSHGGLGFQKGSPSIYGSGYPVLIVDESGNSKEEWIDGFGRIIEVDQPPAQVSQVPGSGIVTISGAEQSEIIKDPCYPNGSCPVWVYDAGTVTVTVNGVSSIASYGRYDTSATVATSLARAVNSNSSMPVTASASGTVVSLTSKTGGLSSDYAYSASSRSTDIDFTVASFTATTEGSTLTDWSPTYYTYSALDELGQVVQGTQTRTYAYDGLGRRVSATIPESGTTSLYFTTSSGALCSGVAQNVCRRADANGTTTTYTYDTLGRLTGKSYSNGQGGVTYTYDQGGAAAYSLGRRTGMTDSSGSESYTYDKVGHVTQLQKVIASQTFTIGYHFNAGGELTQVTYPSGRVVQQSYNVVGQLCEVASSTASCGASASPYATGYVYNPAGQMTQFNYGNGVVATFGFSPTRSQLTSINYAKGSSTLFSLNYFYQKDSSNCPNAPTLNDGRIQCISDLVDSGRTVSYSYDGVGRLLTAVTNGSTNYAKWGLSEGYDAYSNRTTQSVTAGTGPSISLTFSAKNQPTGFTYDAGGNMTLENLSPLGSNSYGYDAENDLVSYTGGSGAAYYTYDAHGLRVQESRSVGGNTVFIFSGGTDIAEYDGGAAPSSPSREFIYSGGSLLAQVSGGTTEYFHADHLSARVITNSSGSIVGQQGHFPFGEAWYASNTTTNWVFTNYERDTGASGLDYALARFYDNRIASFCSADPLDGRPDDPLSWNKYTYVENDPINLTDPSGMSIWGWLGRIIAAIVDALLVFVFHIPPVVPVTPPTFGGGLDLFTLFPGYNPHLARTPTFIGGSITGSSVVSWAASTAAGGEGGFGAPANENSGAFTLFHSCTGPAWITKGNTRKIGHLGAIPPFRVTGNSIAVAPEQFGLNSGDDLRGFSNLVSGTVQYTYRGVVLYYTFGPIRDVIGNGRNPKQFRDELLADHPLNFLIELPGLLPRQFSAEGNVTLRIPSNVHCPSNTE